MKKMLVASAIIAAVQLGGTTSVSAAQCAERGYVVNQLKVRFGETFKRSRSQNDAVLELFASRKNDSWTLILTLPKGLSCMVASGEGYTTANNRFNQHVLKSSS